MPESHWGACELFDCRWCFKTFLIVPSDVDSVEAFLKWKASE